jgi:hypothetical protein
MKSIRRQISIALLILISAFFYFRCDDAGIAPKNEEYCITGQISN